MQNAKSEFEFTSYQLHSDRKKIVFSYKVRLGNGMEETYEEHIVLNEPIREQIPALLLNNILFSLHLMLGVSYYKLHCAPLISILSGQLNPDQADFWNTVYIKGLGEFYFRNNLDFRDLIHFPYVQKTDIHALPYKVSDRSLLGIGGGKDSLVSYELLQKANKSFTPLVMQTNHSYPLIDGIITYLSVPVLKLQRNTDKKVFEKKKKVFNGHIPISAINAFLGIFSCLVYDYRNFIVSNERSANFGNLDYLGMEINHQWSKSLEFEQLFQKYIHSFVTPSITYFSLLRPLSELAIVKVFSSYKKYFSYFSSCNTNFKINESSTNSLWCKSCPKCAFVFSLLSAFISKNDLIRIFGKNLYADNSLSNVYKQLWGIQGNKPFECVGTPDEVKIAFYLCLKNGEFNQDVIMQLFKEEVEPTMKQSETVLAELLKKDSPQTLPTEFSSIISELTL